MFKRFLKPKWQHKDPAIRVTAIKSLNDSNILVDLANNDTELSVQAAAINRISSIEALLKITPKDPLLPELDTKLAALLIKNPLTKCTPQISESLTRINDSSLNEKLAVEAFDSKLRETVIAQVENPEILADRAVEDSSHEVRNIAASRINEESIIRSTLKRLGKKDKRVAKTLREKLDALDTDREQVKQLDGFRLTIEKLGEQTNWKRDQTRLQTIINQSADLLKQAKQPEREKFTQAVTTAQQRINEQQESSEALQPVINAKQSQCQLIEDFCTNLKKRHRVSINEATELDLTLDTLLDDWEELPLLEEKQEAELANRFHRGLTQARREITKLQSNTKQSGNLERCIHKAEQLQKQDNLTSQKIETLVDEWNKQSLPQDEQLAEEYSQQFAQLKSTLEQKLKKQQQSVERILLEINNWLDEIETTLAKDKLGNSEILRNKVQSTLRENRKIPREKTREIDQRLQDINPKIRELSGWRHWGTDRAREELTEEAIALNNTEQAIEERADAVKSLRKRWKDLGKIDPVSRQRLWKKFDAACSEAYAPCKEHFSKQAEQRQKHLVQRKQICSDIESLASETDWSSPDWRQVDKRFHQLRNHWRNTGSVSKKDWQAIYKRFNTAVDAVDQHLKNERRINLNQRIALIEKLEALAETEDLNEAMQQARELQKQWQPSVTAKRGEEQKMWKKFRAASDVIFNRDKQRKQAETAETRELVEAKELLCAEFEDQVLDENIIAPDISKFEQRWKDMGNVHGKEGSLLQHRFTKAKNSAELFLLKKGLSGQKNDIDQMYQRRVLLDDFHTTGNEAELSESWQQLSTIQSSKLAQKLDAIYQSTLSGEYKSAAAQEESTKREDLLLDMEITLELESPETFTQQRMKRQVERLSNKHSDGNSNDAHQPGLNLFESYCLSFPSKDEDIDSTSSRLKLIKNKMEKQLQQQIENS